MSRCKRHHLYVIFDARAMDDEDSATVLDTSRKPPNMQSVADAYGECVVAHYVGRTPDIMDRLVSKRLVTA